jgi:hypothetical protein
VTVDHVRFVTLGPAVVNVSPGGRYTQDVNGLRIQNVTTADNGTYNCRAEVDSDGRYEERPISVIVFSKSVRFIIFDDYENLQRRSIIQTAKC